jgi:hypothetical protein
VTKLDSNTEVTTWAANFDRYIIFGRSCPSEKSVNWTKILFKNRVGKCTKLKLLHKTNDSLFRVVNNFMFKISLFLEEIYDSKCICEIKLRQSKKSKKSKKLTVTPSIIFFCFSINIPDL